jgi:hypothetical protein
MPDVQNINLSKIIKRLELIKSLISLEEEDEIDAHVFKLEQYKKALELFLPFVRLFLQDRLQLRRNLDYILITSIRVCLIISTFYDSN